MQHIYLWSSTENINRIRQKFLKLILYAKTIFNNNYYFIPLFVEAGIIQYNFTEMCVLLLTRETIEKSMQISERKREFLLSF